MNEHDSIGRWKVRNDASRQRAGIPVLLAAVSLLGTSLGVSAAAPVDPTASAKNSMPGGTFDRLAAEQSNQVKLRSNQVKLKSDQLKLRSDQLKLRSNQIKLRPTKPTGPTDELELNYSKLKPTYKPGTGGDHGKPGGKGRTYDVVPDVRRRKP